jgi:hypothetical protein
VSTYTTEADARKAMDDAHGRCRMLVDRATVERRNLTSAEQAEFDSEQARSSAAKAWLGESRGRKSTTNTIDAAFGESRAMADMALRAWACGTRASSTMREAAERYGIDIHNPELDLRALSVGTTTAGGNAVQNETIRAFDLAEK